MLICCMHCMLTLTLITLLVYLLCSRFVPSVGFSCDLFFYLILLINIDSFPHIWHFSIIMSIRSPRRTTSPSGPSGRKIGKYQLGRTLGQVKPNKTKNQLTIKHTKHFYWRYAGNWECTLIWDEIMTISLFDYSLLIGLCGVHFFIDSGNFWEV